MDSTRRIAERGRSVYLTSNQSKVNQTTEAVVSVSEDRSVQGEQREKVGGVAADRKPNLKRFRELLGGRSLPNMTQLMSGEQVEEESVARKALEKPDIEAHSFKATQEGSSEKTDGKEASDTKSKADGTKESEGKASEEKSVSGQHLTEAEQKEVEKLKERDREVRTHEQAHVAAGGQYVRGGIKYDFQRGPDGRNYAVGGHVNIDVSEEKTPEATIVKMQQVKRAALAPAEPSGADRAVAAAAAQKEQQARSEIIEERQEEVSKSRSKVAKEGQKIGGTKGAEEGETSDLSSPESVSASSSESLGPSEAPEAPEAPKVKNHMNLAREARMRIKRGDYWMA